MNKISKKIIIFTICISAIIIAIVLLKKYYFAPLKIYNSAIQLMDEKKYKEASATFDQIYDFKDSIEKSNECYDLYFLTKYDEAIEKYNNHNYMETKKIIKDLMQYNYKDYNNKLVNILSDINIDTIKNKNISSRGIIIGDIVTFGMYEQNDRTYDGKEEIEWIVLDKNENKLLLISKYVLDNISFNDPPATNISQWSDSNLRKWLNSDFYNEAFLQKEKDLISITDTTYNFNGNFISFVSNHTEDKVFILSNDELNRYMHSNESRKGIMTEYAKKTSPRDAENGKWWLRTPGSGMKEKEGATFVCEIEGSTYDGMINDVCFAENGVRPVIWVQIN